VLHDINRNIFNYFDLASGYDGATVRPRGKRRLLAWCTGGVPARDAPDCEPCILSQNRQTMDSRYMLFRSSFLGQSRNAA